MFETSNKALLGWLIVLAVAVLVALAIWFLARRARRHR